MASASFSVISDLQIAVRGRLQVFCTEDENFRSARAQNLKLVLIVVLVLQSKGRYRLPDRSYR